MRLTLLLALPLALAPGCKHDDRDVDAIIDTACTRCPARSPDFDADQCIAELHDSYAELNAGGHGCGDLYLDWYDCLNHQPCITADNEEALAACSDAHSEWARCMDQESD